MSEIAIISTREVIYESSLQKSGKIKVTLKISQNFGTWNLDVKYFGVEKATGTRTALVETGVNEETLEPIYDTVEESYEYLQQNLVLEKQLNKSDAEIDGLFQLVGKSILPNEFSDKFFEIQCDALLMYVKNDFINPEEQDENKKLCIFGLKPNEWEIFNNN
jgi:hypothetical protein